MPRNGILPANPNLIDTELDPRQLAGFDLAQALRDARERTWAWVDDLTDAQWLPPCQAGVNPIAWELAHMAWFAEYWTLRAPHGRDAQGFASSSVPPRFAGPDAHFDSARLAHTARWTTPLPSRAGLKDRLAAQLDASLAVLPSRADPSRTSLDSDLYFHRLALFHEDMHAEALCWLRSELAYPAPTGVALVPLSGTKSLAVPGGRIAIGKSRSILGFAFDNERDGLCATVPPFEIDANPVSAFDYSRFVDSGGYDTPAYWPGPAGAWRATFPLRHPQKWRKNAKGTWEMLWFDTWLVLDGDLPVIHVNAYEAEAYCLWAKRRLPSAAEWECAALSAHGFLWGNSVWEWTTDAFQPYPGFTAGPYREYSQPWFGNHRELRGGAFATHKRMHNPHYRNFFLPQRSDIFAGFRTVFP